MKRLFLIVFLITPQAKAEFLEHQPQAHVGLFVPSFESADTGFKPAGVDVAMGYQFGLSDNLDVGFRFSYAYFSARADHTHIESATDRSYDGVLDFTGASYRPELTARYKVFAGHLIAPYVEASLGYGWTTYHNTRFADVHGRDFEGINVGDFGRGAPFASGGMGVDWRIANLVMVGISLRYLHGFDSLFKGAFVFPIYATLYF